MNSMTQLCQKACAVQARTWFLSGFLACIGMELAAIYFQFVVKLEPCPLCITQRLIVFSLALVFLAGALHNPGPGGVRLYAGLAALVSLAGALVAAYHFSLQLLPHQELASCGPGAAYILEHFQLADAVRLFLTGTGDCTVVVWTFLGLSMPFWVGLSFIGIFALSVWQFVLSDHQLRAGCCADGGG
jgi:disulfide bond formation protein DsbB